MAVNTLLAARTAEQRPQHSLLLCARSRKNVAIRVFAPLQETFSLPSFSWEKK